MSDHHLQNRINRNLQLMEERRNILMLPAEKALDAILDSNAPATLVQSFPEEDLYMLIHDIGVEDALPILSIASSDQWKFIIDIEVWSRDRINHLSITKWLDLLHQAESKRTLNWLVFENLELFEFHLNKYIEVGIREHDQDPSEFGEEYFTYDDFYFIKFKDLKSEDPADQKVIDYGKEVISNLLENLSKMNNLAFQSILHEAMSVIPPEIEEDDYRMRNVRLAEKGFLPFDEAIEIYAPLQPEDLSKKSSKIFPGIKGEVALNPIPMYSFGMLNKNNKFTTALANIDNDEILLQLQIEFATLCNNIISADQKKVKEKEELAYVVKKACGFISIGLEMQKDKNIVSIIKKNTLSDIFRSGYTQLMSLKWDTNRWFKNSWYKKGNLSPAFFGEDVFGVIGGLLLPKPLYFDNYKNKVMYREFESLDDIAISEEIVTEAKGFDLIFSLMDIDRGLINSESINYKNVILTLWAKHYLGLKDEGFKIELSDLKTFFGDLFSDKKIKTSMKENFLSFLTAGTELSTLDISENMGNSLEKLFNEVESEYGPVEVKDLEARYIELFIL
ncbi:MAG: hypothetical protein GY760_02720 [Deltaproteobacteria bacterium]|nr:hypothetical protein [Deltaproteobacteria bacterium]